MPAGPSLTGRAKLLESAQFEVVDSQFYTISICNREAWRREEYTVSLSEINNS